MLRGMNLYKVFFCTTVSYLTVLFCKKKIMDIGQMHTNTGAQIICP